MVEPGPRKDTSSNDFLSAVLTPGSSLNSTVLLVVDGVLALLALTLVHLSLPQATGGSVHPIVLLLIEALWVSAGEHQMVSRRLSSGYCTTQLGDTGSSTSYKRRN
jgi:hypothetical protein